MAFAVIATGGKQYLAEEGRYFTIEHIPGVKVGDKMTFDQVLFEDSDKEAKVGTPTTGGKVIATVLEAEQGDKKVVIKYKAKSRYFKKRGHRQLYLKVKIDKIA